MLPMLKYEPGLRLYKRFVQFHKDNPEVYVELVSMARKLQRRGRKKIGIGMLFEVLRWHYYMTTISDDEYKLANAHRAFYTRLIEQQESDLQGFFTRSESVADTFFDEIQQKDKPTPYIWGKKG